MIRAAILMAMMPAASIASPQVSTVPENETAIVAIREWSGM